MLVISSDEAFEYFIGIYPTIASFYVALRPDLELQMTYNEGAKGGVCQDLSLKMMQ